MPGFDGTGPSGGGPFTGRAMGYCVVRMDDKDGKRRTKDEKEVNDMPRGDGTGPAGTGPMTGRAAGFCAGYSAPGYANPVYGRGGGFGRVFGRSSGRGPGRGWAAGACGRGYPFYGAPYTAPYVPAEIKPEQEADMLKQQARALQDELDAVNQRIKELKPAEGSESGG